MLKNFITALLDACNIGYKLQLSENSFVSTKQTQLFSSCPISTQFTHACTTHLFLFVSCTVSCPTCCQLFLRDQNTWKCTYYMSYKPVPKFISQTRHFSHKHQRKFLLLKKIRTLILYPLLTITCLQNGRGAIKIASCVYLLHSPLDKEDESRAAPQFC